MNICTFCYISPHYPHCSTWSIRLGLKKSDQVSSGYVLSLGVLCALVGSLNKYDDFYSFQYIVPRSKIKKSADARSVHSNGKEVRGKICTFPFVLPIEPRCHCSAGYLEYTNFNSQAVRLRSYRLLQRPQDLDHPRQDLNAVPRSGRRWRNWCGTVEGMVRVSHLD